MVDTTTRRLLTVSETAAYLRCSAYTIRRRIADGSIPARKFGRSYRIDLDELEAAAAPVAPADARSDSALAERFAAHIARSIAAAPPLSPDQVSRISALLTSAAS